MIYLDSSSTTKPKSEVIDYTINILRNNWGNPSSIYEYGMESKRIIENARRTVAEFINAEPEEIYFTPSASASNAIATGCFMKENSRFYNFITTNIEHSSINKYFHKDVWKYYEEVDRNGFVNAEQFKKYRKSLVSVMAANNEIGSIQPIKEICSVVKENMCVFHSDLTQYIPYFKVDVKELGLDMASFSAHKLGGLKGCGVFYKNKDIKVNPLVFGSQQDGIMAGTENIYGIAALGKAIELIDYSKTNEIRKKRDYLLENLLKIEGIKLNGSIENRLPNNINIRIDGICIENQQILAMLDIEGYCLSAGSACNSYEKTPSHVLKAIGLSDSEANRSIRITISEENTYEELDKFVIDLKNIVDQFKNI